MSSITWRTWRFRSFLRLIRLKLRLLDSCYSQKVERRHSLKGRTRAVDSFVEGKMTSSYSITHSSRKCSEYPDWSYVRSSCMGSLRLRLDQCKRRLDLLRNDARHCLRFLRRLEYSSIPYLPNLIRDSSCCVHEQASHLWWEEELLLSSSMTLLRENCQSLTQEWCLVRIRMVRCLTVSNLFLSSRVR